MAFDQFEEIGRQKVCDISPEIPRRVGHDDIELATGVEPELAPSVVDDDLDLRIGQHRSDFRHLGDELHVTRIDLDDRE